MKKIVNVTLNYGKSLKSGEEDKNNEVVYAEANFILAETSYRVSNHGNMESYLSVSETEIYLTKDSCKKLMNIFKDVHSELVKLEKRENK